MDFCRSLPTRSNGDQVSSLLNRLAPASACGEVTHIRGVTLLSTQVGTARPRVGQRLTVARGRQGGCVG